ncbi:uncharacterized protein LOC118556385 [Fundulus heteroclitus]|uniref:uncharacterized protein LOC118556385 n=1 Tax=Fundulus heteroclitus TaxID=8078 RepID=UPI00165C0EB5|nr:uncharacterized protein LOC118556385 [Fundulus heteroclitus]
MAKGKAKININENMAPAQTRSLRSKKRECSTSESSQAHDVQASLLQKETEGDVKGADNGALQSNLQDGATVTNIEHQGEERPSLSKPDDATDMANNKKEETSVHDPTHRFEVETCGDQANDPTNEKETSSEECSRSPGQPQILAPPSENDLESCCVVLEKQVVGNRPSNLKRNQDGNRDNPGFGVSAVSETAVGLPAKKKRRMGMSGLTEKERSHFLQAGQHNGAKSGEEIAAKQKHSKTMKPVALDGDDSPAYLESSPPHISAEVVEQREEEPESPHSGEDQR